MSDEQKKPEQIHRRDILKWGAMAGAAVAIGASGLGGLAPLVQTAAKPSKKDEKRRSRLFRFTESIRPESQLPIRRMSILLHWM